MKDSTPSPTPSIDDWRSLYRAASDFKKIGSWEWVADTDVFGIQNPADGLIGYCCVMGELGEMLGLVVYLGTEGLAGYLKIQSGKAPMDTIEFLHSQKCLAVTFEDRKYLRKPDLDVVKKLGLKLRGHQAWPLFRNYQPGYLPWYINREEALYLTTALEQAGEVALRLRENRGLLIPPEKDHYLVRVAKREGAVSAWEDRWLAPGPIKKGERTVPPVDELRLERIRKVVSRRQGIWEIDLFHSPSTVDEGGRPYFPYVFLSVDHGSGLVLNIHVAAFENYRSDFQNQYIGFLGKVELLPEEIWLLNGEAFKLLEPIASHLEIKLKQVHRLPELEKVRAHLAGYFR